MHSRTSTKLSNRIYKKWVERFRMPFHVGVGIVCIFLRSEEHTSELQSQR